MSILSLKDEYKSKSKFSISWTENGQHTIFLGAALFVLAGNADTPDKDFEYEGEAKGIPLPKLASKVKNGLDEGTAFVTICENVDITKCEKLLTLPYGLMIPTDKELLKETEFQFTRIWKMPASILNRKWTGHTASIAVSNNMQLSIKLQETRSGNTAYIAIPYESAPSSIKFQLGKNKYSLSGWDEETKSYKNIIPQKTRKDNAMNKEINFDDLGKVDEKLKDTLKEAQAEATAKTAEANAAFRDILEGVKEKMPTVQAKEESKKEATVEPKEENKETSTSEVKTDQQESDSNKKITRKRAPKTQTQDLQPVIDNLNGTVEKDISIDDAITEIRQLRDLIMVASRRLTNISLAVMDRTKDDAATLAQLKSLLK